MLVVTDVVAEVVPVVVNDVVADLVADVVADEVPVEVADVVGLVDTQVPQRTGHLSAIEIVSSPFVSISLQSMSRVM